MSDLLEVAEALVIRPGDTLIVRVPTNTDMATAARIKDGLVSRLPGIADVLIVSVDGLAVYRPDSVEVP